MVGSVGSEVELEVEMFRAGQGLGLLGLLAGKASPGRKSLGLSGLNGDCLNSSEVYSQWNVVISGTD